MLIIKIRSWLLEPKVWSFVCFVSSVVGLLCYALSTSFNHLFGKWTWWKTLLYIVFSFIVCLAVLFAKAWERSTSTWLEAHMAFLILFFTSVYSFFFDKEVKGKPDAYSLFSCAAFAIMSLSMSRLSHFGFEVDLLYFFSGVLTIQLMKIKIWLVVVGGSFSYSLILLRSTLGASPTRIEYRGLQLRDDLVIEIDSQGTSHSTSQLHPDVMIITQQDAHVPLEFPVNSLSQQGNSFSDNNIMERFMGCIEALKKENENLMDTISKHVSKYLKANVVNEDQIHVCEIDADDNLVVDALLSSGIIINDLRETVRLMVAAGLKVECCRAYRSCRRKFLRKSVSNFWLRMQDLNVEEDIDKLMIEIQCWIKVLNVAVMILFPNERTLCDRVFEGSISSVEKYHVSLGNDALWGDKSLNILMNLVYFSYADKEQATVTPVGGGVHQITHCVLDYMNRIDWQKPLSLFVEVDRIIIMKLLETCLEAISKIYNNPTLGYIFIMNNWRQIQLAATQPQLNPIFGDYGFKKSTTKVQQNLELYQRSSWNKIVDILKVDIDEVEPNVAAEVMKDKLHSFNEHLDEICNVQSAWFVFDEQLREQLIKSIENMVLPAYGNFLGRLQDFLGKHAYEYIKYGMFDVQYRLNNNLFLVWEKELE
ncbi:exocyst complex component EXO70B1-like [Glycine soja]|uniref:Exocyst subunit Exo70 family protein n=1 Tax=Glycine soja TaxID=3848 RepID=A0A445GB77_GLYSO|nr:exocyst complex component EXO70B1-like [Glycine soja]KHN12800.1 Exocyst complex component 7 [Glycine soja]RZB58424.1 Exocyst complex component EXO70B1 [Glycine soja]